MKLLVAGDTRVDAGKTTFAAGLVSTLDGVGFKPRAGNDYWYDHDDALAAVGEGRLYGKDVARLAAAGGSDHTIEQLNPVHRLWRPTPDRTGMLGETGRTFLVDRITTPTEPVFICNGVAEAAGLLPDRLCEQLPLETVERVNGVGAFNEIMEATYLPAFQRVADRIAATDPAVVESYADIALPVSGIEFDAAAVVDPTRVRIYDGSRYLKACEVASGSAREGQLEERVGRVVEMIEPVSTHTLQPLTEAQRGDSSAVAAAYDSVYASLLAAARNSPPA